MKPRAPRRILGDEDGERLAGAAGEELLDLPGVLRGRASGPERLAHAEPRGRVGSDGRPDASRRPGHGTGTSGRAMIAGFGARSFGSFAIFARRSLIA